jgi:hypothetical protein
MRETRSITLKKLHDFATQKLKAFEPITFETMQNVLDTKDKKIDYLVLRSIESACAEFTCLYPIRSFHDIDHIKSKLLSFDESTLAQHIEFDIQSSS